ncbi:MAG TPA: DnaJ domain-containing protein [Nitrospiraceae bacterium]|nr:DnaJ domain-containing protein [Nitrospiraceae bacterium]
MDSTKDYYGILEISRSESVEGIHRAYRRLAKQHHPDHAGVEGAARFRAIQEAYDVLSDPERKRRYDETLHARRAYRHTTAEPLVPPTVHAARPEPFAASPRGVERDGGRVLRDLCRTELYEFARIAELLLSPVVLTMPLTEDEVVLLRLYLRELTDRYGL